MGVLAYVPGLFDAAKLPRASPCRGAGDVAFDTSHRLGASSPASRPMTHGSRWNAVGYSFVPQDFHPLPPHQLAWRSECHGPPTSGPLPLRPAGAPPPSCPDLFRASISATATALKEMSGTSPARRYEGMTGRGSGRRLSSRQGPAGPHGRQAHPTETPSLRIPNVVSLSRFVPLRCGLSAAGWSLRRDPFRAFGLRPRQPRRGCSPPPERGPLHPFSAARSAPTLAASAALRKSSILPSSTPWALPFSTPVRRSFTIW